MGTPVSPKDGYHCGFNDLTNLIDNAYRSDTLSVFILIILKNQIIKNKLITHVLLCGFYSLKNNNNNDVLLKQIFK